MEAALVKSLEQRLTTLETSLNECVKSSAADSDSAEKALAGLEQRLTGLENVLITLQTLLAELAPRLVVSEGQFSSLPEALNRYQREFQAMRTAYQRMATEFNALGLEIASMRSLLSG
jgi:chromosome segregation ATPase